MADTEMIEVRCNFCHKLALEASSDLRGRIKTRCKKCAKWIDVTLPFKSRTPVIPNKDLVPMT